MISIRRRMRARSIDEVGRVSTPLELIFDLTFVVAVSLLVDAFADAVGAGDGWEVLPRFLMTFFAIWWAWDQFSWLASAYDTDDVPYRVLTMVQMAGVLVLASGVPAAFERDEWLTVAIGYLIMRIGLVASISRAIRDDTETGRVALRYVIGISVVQVFWLLRLLLPPDHGYLELSFVVVALAELAVPLWAERAGGIKFHPHHIAERHGSFTLILLGESVLAAATAFRDVLAETRLDVPLSIAGVAALVILFGLWWIYFEEPAGERLEANRGRAFFYAYGHFIVFAALALVGAGLDVVVTDVSHQAPVAAWVASGTVAWPVAIFLVALWAVHAPLGDLRAVDPVATWSIAVLIAAVPFASGWLGALWSTVAVAALVATLVATVLIRKERRRVPAI